jgi:bifunctional non-homologous end joining protein LigD
MLKTYREKRRFDVTPEPRGQRARRTGNAFVVQKHAARRLHYDLRLELDGAMKSWAVTRGPSLVPGDKRLAVHVEDHPIEYNRFEGKIPPGQYGAGTVQIWDRGKWEPEGDPHKGYEKGHLAFRLHGKKLQGGWHLVRMRRKNREKHEPWLLIKASDEAARTERDRDILEEQPLSVSSGRSMEEIAAGKPRGKKAKAGARALRKTPAKKRPAPTKRAKQNMDADPVRGTRAGSLPKFVPPCLALLTENPPSNAGWVHEIKFDGYRIQARIDRGKVTLLTRKGLDWTKKFSGIAQAVGRLDVAQALIDGEIVSETEDGRSSFSALQEDLKTGRADRLVYYVFDLLHLDGRDLIRAPLIERKRALERLVGRLSRNGTIRFSEHFTEPGPKLLQHACRLGLEGIVSKRGDGRYRPGRHGDWLKSKCSQAQEFVVCGYAPSTAERNAVGALVLGYYDKGKLQYAGRTGTGFTHEMARELFRRVQPLRRDTPPFAERPEEERLRPPQWLEPKLVAEVEFKGWTHGNRVRQAAFKGLREDKPAREVVREDQGMAARTDKPRATPRKAKQNAASVAGLRLTNPDRVYWEDAGVTKQDLVEFYADIWKWIEPHLVRRPLALLRCPEGISGDCFFQKHASAGLDEQHLLMVREPGEKPHTAVADLHGLITLVQAGVLEIHTWGTTVDHLETCDRLVFDLDPGPGVAWRAVKAAACEIRQRLEGLRLKSFLKTTGGKGLHVVVPIEPTPWEKAKAFARAVAESMAKDDPSKYVAKATKSAREGRIYVDYLRNGRGATAIAPYSTRARPGAPVSTPIAWRELGALDSSNRFTVGNLRARLKRLRSDPWAGIARVRQRLP